MENKANLHLLGFADAASFVYWLGKQTMDTLGLWLKIAKQGSGTPSLTKADAIDAALRHGWIDGQLAKFDDQYWLIRFTPRKLAASGRK